MRKNACISNPRNIAIIEAFKSGVTITDLGDKYGVTRQAVHHIIKRFGLNAASGGRSVRAIMNMTQRMSDQRIRRKTRKAHTATLFGCTDEELDALNGGLRAWDKTGRAYAFMRQKSNAKTRCIDFLLTFPEWCEIWDRSDKYHLRGRGHGYVMSRYGDSGPYATWNVYICNATENNSDGGKKSARLRQAHGPSHHLGRGRGWTIYRGKYVVQFRGKRIGQFSSQQAAEDCYKQVVADYFADLKAPKRQAEAA